MTPCFGILRTGKLFTRLEVTKKRINFATFSPDGKMIATTSADKSVIIWDAESSKQITTYNMMTLLFWHPLILKGKISNM